jgi:hypothetical protein
LDRFVLAGFVVAAVLTLVFHMNTLIVILLVVTAGFLGVRYGERL